MIVSYEDNFKTVSKRLGFCWFHDQTDGSIYATGFLEDITGDIPFKIVKNLNKLKETHADYVLIRREPRDEEEEPKEYLI